MPFDPAIGFLETLEALGAVSGRAILEASGVGARQVAWEEVDGAFSSESLLIKTEQPLGAIAVYLCEPASDDGIIEAGFSPTPDLGGAFEVVRWID